MTAERESRILARELVSQRAEKMLEIVRGRQADLPEQLRLNAIVVMQNWKTITLKLLDVSPDSDCNIAGVYLSDATPPEIGVFASLSARRQSFTALHEFGHHLQTFDELVDELAGQPDRGRALEEMACDVFASRILIPESMANQYLGTGTPTARQVAALYDAGTASRAAVCVAAVQQLESPGHVILLDDYGIVDFATSNGLPRLARGTGQPDAEIVKSWASTQRTSVETRTRFSYRDGIQGESLYAQASAIGGYTVIVAVMDKAPWEKLSLSSTDTRLVAKWHTCERCEHVFEVWARCEICRQPKCPECAWCDCKKQRERDCEQCFTRKSAQLFDDPVKNICRDCAS